MKTPTWRPQPERPDGDERWSSHPIAAFALRCAIRLSPALAALACSVLALMYLPESYTATWWPGRVLLIVGSLLVAFGVERVARRLLPLAALLRLTLLFPDKAPSRLKVARRSRSPRTVSTDVALSAGRSEAAERVLELLALLTAHDSKTRGHCERVRVYSDLLADQLGLTQLERDRLRWVALLHDIGKIQVDAAILNKPGKPSDREWAALRAHPEQGALLIAPLLEWLGEWSSGVIEHHERFDGTGYPQGLAGEQISRAGRILSIVDAFEVMTAARAYKRAMSARAARVELADCAGTHFDPVIVRSFLAISLPKLLATTGPLGLLAQAPILSRIGQVAQQVPAASGAAAATTASSLVAASLTASALAPATPISVPESPAASASPVTSVESPPAGVQPAAVQPIDVPSPVSVTPTPNPIRTATPTPTPAPSPSDSAPAPDLPTPTPTPPAPTPPPPPPAPAAPDAPQAPTGTPGDQQVTVSWVAPLDNGSPIVSYTVTPADVNGSLAAVTVDGSTTSTIIDGLTNGTDYTFTVTATNAGGSQTSLASPVVTPAGQPGAPSAVTASAGDGQVSLSWTASVADGSSITSYTVTPFGPTGALSPTVVNGSLTAATIGGLINGDSYTFIVVASNAVGTSPAANSNPVTPAGVPASPGNVSVTAGDSQATVFWSAPADNGAPVVSYTVTPIGPGGPLSATTVSAAATSVVIGGMTNGTSYSFTVTATNAVGSSAAAASGTVTPAAPPLLATAPLSPLLPSATAGLNSADITWAAPLLDGGSPITYYTITAYNGGTPMGSWTVAPAVTSFTAGGLTPGISYTFDITATNAVGTSLAASTFPVSPVGTPDPVTSLVASAGDATVTLSWTTPASDGGSPITGYTITPTGPGGPLAPIQLGAGATGTTVSGLVNGTTYSFTVVANNAYGSSANATTGPVTPATASPTGVSGVPDNASVTVSWTAPASGATVTSYTVSACQNGVFVTSTTVTAPQTTAIVNGLTNGTAYTFTVVANTTGGPSQASAPSAPVTPTTVPGGVGKPPNPTHVQAIGGTASATVSWTAPNVPAQGPVTSYLISVYNASDKPTGQTFLVDGNTLSATIVGLTSGAQYRFLVQATNIAGTSGGTKTGNVNIN